MKPRTILLMAVCAALMALPLFRAWPPPARAQGQNLLTDGDFEAPPTWPMQDGIGEVQVAPGWRAWYLDTNQVPSYVKMPTNCDSPQKTDCYWMRPEFRDTTLESTPNRVHGGIRAQKYFSFGRMHEAGLYQRVIGLTPGAQLRFSIYTQAWQCFEISKCGKNGIVSDQPADMHLRVGIDPFGGTNPFSSNIVWSPERPAFDQWVQFVVEAQAKGDAVTVFTHSRPEWEWARNNNDIYLDDASLVVIGQGAFATGTAPAATQPAGSPAPTRTPAASPSPRPDGTVVHVVQAGDTLYGIALQYDVTVDDLLKLNNLERTSILNLGQEIVVKVGKGTVIAPRPTATLTRTTTTLTSPITPTVAPPTATRVPPTATPIPSGLCLSAFEDLNNNAVRDGNERGLSGVTFIVSAGGNEVARYSADASGVPYCLTQLTPGSYSVQVILPPGYIAPFEQTNVTTALGQRVELAVAARKGEKATPTVEPTVPAQTSSPGLFGSSTALIVIAIFGVLILALAGVAIAIMRRGK
jgi:LysM repeat protein